MKSKWIVLAVAVCFVVSGCAVNVYKNSPKARKKIKSLETKVDELERLRLEEQARFEEAKRELERKLKGQISDKEVQVKMQGGGLAVVLSDNILFDSGKSKLKKAAFYVLDKVADVIKREFSGNNVGVEGHTDNVPIKYSKWKSNWELSTARATTVLHYLEKKGLSSGRLSATGHGEHKPIASNKTEEGRSRNRRVEIIIIPEYARKQAAAEEAEPAETFVHEAVK